MEDSESGEARRRPSILVWIALGTGALFFLLLGMRIAATLFVPDVIQKFAVASRGMAKADITQIESALIEYRLVNGGKWPDSLGALATPDMNGYTYIKGTRIPKDPWGNEYLYRPPGPEGGRPIVSTLGRDGQPGGEGDDADMDNLSIRSGR